MEDWRPHAARLAADLAHIYPSWAAVVERMPRHLFVPHWWTWRADAGLGRDIWEPIDGRAEPISWLENTYSDRSLVTRVGRIHADHAKVDEVAEGRPTSSATKPGLVVQMFRHACLHAGAAILDVGTGSGYSTALLSARYGEESVTSVDVDAYLAEAAATRLGEIGLHPRVVCQDANAPLPGEYDRLVAMVSVWPVPASWLSALRPGGRLVVTLANTMAIITATKNADGTAIGRIEHDQAGFMETRSGPDYPPPLPRPEQIDTGEQSAGKFPIIQVDRTGELASMLEITAPGIQHHYEQHGETRTAWMLHSDGSWARATTPHSRELPDVVQGGPRRLWDILEGLRDSWLSRGFFRLRGARVDIEPSGVIHLSSGPWKATIK